ATPTRASMSQEPNPMALDSPARSRRPRRLVELERRDRQSPARGPGRVRRRLLDVSRPSLAAQTCRAGRPRARTEASSGGLWLTPRVPGNSVIGVDVGGTKILAGIVDRDGNVVHSTVTPTPTRSEAAFLAGLEGAIAALLDEREGVSAVGLGLPSVIDQRTGS